MSDKDPRAIADGFVTDLKERLGARLHGALLFGSAARGEWQSGISDVNVLVLLDDIDAPVLGKAAPSAVQWAERGVRPLMMELAEWRRASDVFTIELADMKDSSIALLGEDPVRSAVVQPSILRLQAERELRGKLLHLHSGMLMLAEDRKRLGQLFVRSLPSFLTYLRVSLRLAGQEVPTDMRGVIDAGCTLTGADPAPFRKLLDARSSGSALELSLQDALADDYNTAGEKIAAYIDTWGR